MDEQATGFTADDISAGSSTVLAVWRCGQEYPNGKRHTYCATPNARTNAARPSGCSICAGKVITPESSLQAVAPGIADQWDQEANDGRLASSVAPQDNKDYWWGCEVAEDHRWQASPNNRVGKGSGCPFCAGQNASSTNNVTLSDRLMKMWDFERNSGVDPASLTLGSNTEVYWKCLKHPKEHRPRKAKVQKRYRGQGCPSCAGHDVTATNSLAANYPELADQVDPTRKPFKTADEISFGENGNVHWRCPVWPEAHVWPASPNNRTAGDTGCPHCRQPGSSKQEIRIMAELAAALKADPTFHRVPGVPGPGGGRCDVDLIINRLRLILDFDGSYWHGGTQQRDRKKSQLLEDAGWKVCRIRESPLEPLGPLDVQVPFEAPPSEAARLTLDHLAAHGVIDGSVAEAYKSAPAPIAAQEAELVIQRKARMAGP